MSEQVQESTLIGLSERLESELRLHLRRRPSRATESAKLVAGITYVAAAKLFRLVGYSRRDDDSPTSCAAATDR